MRLRYTLPALADLDGILAHIAAHAPQAARNVGRRIHAVVELLLRHPRIGTPTQDPTIRRISTPPYPYLIFYEVAGGEVIIHAVRHGARDPSTMPGA